MPPPRPPRALRQASSSHHRNPTIATHLPDAATRPQDGRGFARAADAQDLLPTTRTCRGLLDEYAPYLRERVAGGCVDATVLTREITELGCRGGAKTVRRFLQPLRTAHTAPPSKPASPSVRRVTGWLTRRPDWLTDEDRAWRDALLAHSPALATTGRLVREFAEIMVDRRGQDLNAWIGRARREGAPALRPFAAGLVRDLDAVTAGLTLPHSPGTVEGHVNRIKMLKRKMDGRANFDLLRKRVHTRRTVKRPMVITKLRQIQFRRAPSLRRYREAFASPLDEVTSEKRSSFEPVKHWGCAR